jgi:hypothetical protein
MDTKRCYGKFHESEEDKYQPLDRFTKNKAKKDGLSQICKTCASLTAKEARSPHSKHKATAKRYYQKNKPAYISRQHRNKSTPTGMITRLLASARCRAKSNNLTFDLVATDITIPTTCPVLGIPIVLTNTGSNNKGGKDTSPSIDRVDTSKGYTKDNIVVVSWRANRLKSDATLDELTKLYEYYSL